MRLTDRSLSISVSSIPLAKPQTPIRRVTALLRSPLQLGKRARPRSHSLDTERLPISRPLYYTPPPAVALQTTSSSTDSIIITSFQHAPFCCHEDLVTMPRPELVQVAQSINGRLPKALQIACGDDVEDADIRRAIEVLTGIRAETAGDIIPPVPGAPRAVRTKSMSAVLEDETSWDVDNDSSATGDRSVAIPSSPLAMRRPRLEMLKEEQEHEEPLRKRRRASPQNDHTLAACVPTASGSRLIESIDISASPLLGSDSSKVISSLTSTQGNVQRRRSARLSGHNPHPREFVIRLPFASSPKAQPTRMLRSYSQRASLTTSAQGSKLKRTQSDANVTLTRPKYHFRRGRATPKVADPVGFVPEVEKTLQVLPMIHTGSGLAVDFLTPRARSASASTTVSQGKSEIGSGVVEAMGEMVV
ncbi:hypothetical protein DEU56DRAFT_335891 [Suillus clintonianus]|uniref:uncharacterized protein n=1 Tax=Suillus clintonianus TaxID=1904413 RepID=UPI001B86DCAE|nr:uncharacterized protein DEU56DRAFT_335891 [Suillus clintonianus]KAG2138489.1 hypothetical protein DEU56DRAFT_335891 [Suillus clintonianus]